jgi:hypothetical protein
LTEDRKLKEFQNRVLRKISGPKRDELTGDWRRLRNEDLYDLYSSTNIFREMKSIQMRRAGNGAHMRKREVHQGFGGDTCWKETTWET